MDDQEFHTAALVFAHYIGIDLDVEPELIKFAEDALEDLPPDWELGIGEGDNNGIPYYFNTKTNKSVWVHPKESKYRQIVEDERKKLATKKQNNRSNAHDRDGSRERGGTGGHAKSHRDAADMTVVEDFDEEAVALEKPKVITIASNQNKKDSSERPKFGMSADDFFDKEPDELRDYSRLGSRSESLKNQVDSPEKPTASVKSSEKPDFKPIFSKNWLDDDKTTTKSGAAEKYKLDTDRYKAEKLTAISTTVKKEDPVAASNDKGVSFSNLKREENVDRGRGDDRSRPASRGESSSRPQGAEDRGRDYRRSDSRDQDADRDRDRDRPSSRGGNDKDRDKSRERDKSYNIEYDRDRGRSMSPSSSRFYEDEARRLKGELQAVTDELEREKRKSADLTAEKEDSLERMRRDMHRVDSDLAVKTAEVRRLQEEVDSADIRARRQLDAAVEETHSKHRDAIRLLKIELEDEWRVRLDASKKRSQEEVADVRREVDETKKRLEVAAEESEAMRRKVINSREDGRSEASVALETCRAELREMEDRLRLQSIELKRVKEDHASLSMKASGAMQSAHVSLAESEAIKAQATSAIAEAHSSQAALMMATQRLQQADTETSKMRAENTMLKREVDSLSQELKKYQAQSFVATDGITAAEAEGRRAKARMQAEINRLTTRCSELAGLNSALQTTVDTAEEEKNNAVREVLQQLSRAESEQHVSMIRLHDADERNERSLAAISKSDGELRAMRELLQKKERTIRELIQAKDDISVLLEDERMRSQMESDSNRKEIKDLRVKLQEADRQLRSEKDAIMEEMSKKIPEIAKSASMEAEKLCMREMEYKLSALRSEYEMKIEQKSRELMRTQTVHEEVSARLKSANADDKAEVERLQFQVRRLQRRCDELEADAEDRRRQSVLATPQPYAMQQGPAVYPTQHHPAYRYAQTPHESIDGTIMAHSLGINQSRMSSQGNAAFPAPPSQPQLSQSVDMSNGFASIEEQRFIEMMQNEIKGIQEQLSRSTNTAAGVTPAARRWEPQYSPLLQAGVNNRTMSFAEAPRQHYLNTGNNYDNSRADDSRNESRAWAELLAKQNKSKAVGKHSADVAFGGSMDENAGRSHRQNSSPENNVSSSGSDKRKSKSDYISPHKSGKMSKRSTPVKSSAPEIFDENASFVDSSSIDSGAGYQPGYWKTKYMR